MLSYHNVFIFFRSWSLENIASQHSNVLMCLNDKSSIPMILSASFPGSCTILYFQKHLNSEIYFSLNWMTQYCQIKKKKSFALCCLQLAKTLKKYKLGWSITYCIFMLCLSCFLVDSKCNEIMCPSDVTEINVYMRQRANCESHTKAQ